MAYDSGLAERVRSVLGRICPFEEKKMFGGVAYMVNGSMCCGIVKNDLMLRLGDDGVRAALAEPHTRPMDFTGRPMRSMLYVEPPGMDSEAELETWIRRAVVFAGKGGRR